MLWNRERLPQRRSGVMTVSRPGPYRAAVVVGVGLAVLAGLLSGCASRDVAVPGGRAAADAAPLVPAAPVDRRPVSSTITAGGVTTTLRLASTVASTGTTLHATVTLINRSGAPIRTAGCRNTIVAVSLTRGRLAAAQDLRSGRCARRFWIPVGAATFPATVTARDQPTLAPLPPGRYHAKVEPLTIQLPLPPAITVTLTAAAANVDRGQPARCDLDTRQAGHVAETNVVIGGVRYYRFTDTGRQPCLILDAPDLQLLDHGRRLQTVGSIPDGGAGPSAPRQTITLRPGHPTYLYLFGLDRAGFGTHPPPLVCPTSTSLRMTFPYSSGSVTITGPAGTWSTYEQLGGTKLACGLIDILPLSTIPSDGVAV